MSRGLGEVQIQALEGFAKYHLWRESLIARFPNRQPRDWLTLKALKLYAWGDRRNAAMYPNSDLCGARRSKSGEYKDNHHSSFKRALTLLVRGGFVEVGARVGPDGMPVRESRRIKPTLEYRLTPKGKCAVAQLHT